MYRRLLCHGKPRLSTGDHAALHETVDEVIDVGRRIAAGGIDADFLIRNEDGKESAGQAALLRFRKIDVSRFVFAEEIGFSGHDRENRVIVAIENRN